MLWLVSLAALASAPSIHRDDVARLTLPLADGFESPSARTVRDFWSRAAPLAAPVPVVRATVSWPEAQQELAGVFWLLEGGQPRLLYLEGIEGIEGVEGVDPDDVPWGSEIVADPAGWTVGEVRIDITWRSAAVPIDRARFGAWSYVEVLADLESSLYDEVPKSSQRKQVAALDQLASAEGEAATRAALRAVMKAPPEANDRAWNRILTAAEAVGDTAIRHQAYRYFQPEGACSMDNSPAYTAREYADFCYDQGQTACAIQLQVASMDYWAQPRSVWSSYGEAATPTGVDRLAQMGLDVPTFLLGLALEYQGVHDTQMSLQRLGRAIRESEGAAATVAAFQQLATDPTVDEWNRIVAAIVLHHAVGRRLDDSGFSPIARGWLAQR